MTGADHAAGERWKRAGPWGAVAVLALSGLVGAAGFWDDESWRVLVPAAGAVLAIAVLGWLFVARPSGRWSTRALGLVPASVSRILRTRRGLAFGTSLLLAVLGGIGIVRGILGQWDGPIFVGAILMGIAGAVLETLARQARRRDAA